MGKAGPQSHPGWRRTAGWVEETTPCCHFKHILVSVACRVPPGLFLPGGHGNYKTAGWWLSVLSQWRRDHRAPCALLRFHCSLELGPAGRRREGGYHKADLTFVSCKQLTAGLYSGLLPLNWLSQERKKPLGRQGCSSVI